MNIFQNLCPHESILMILGIVLFAALIFAFIWSVVKEKKFAILLPFFLLPVIMVGYPSLGTIRYENNKFELENQKQKLFEGDYTPEEYEAFTNAYLAISQSCKASNDAEAQESLAEAQLATGNFEEAREIANRTLSIQPENLVAQEIVRKSSEQIQQENEFQESISQLKRIMSLTESGRMERVEAVKRMDVILSELQPPQNIETRDALVMAKALAYTGEKRSALQVVDQVMKNPRIEREELTQAAELKGEIENDQYAPPQRQGFQDEGIRKNPALTPEILNQQRLKMNIPLKLQINNDQ
jgi:tetratricopeptide (TPR) repeat protein